MFNQSVNTWQAKLLSSFLVLLTFGTMGLALARPAQASTTTSATANAVTEFGSYRVPAGSTHTFTRSFRPGDTISVMVEGDTTTDLDVYVYDPYGRRVATDDDYTDQCFVSFNVYYSGAYTIRVVNRGQAYNDYDILFDRD